MIGGLLKRAIGRDAFSQFGFDEFGDTLLFAAGGQAAAASAPLATVEVAQVDVFGQPGAWAVAPSFAIRIS